MVVGVYHATTATFGALKMNSGTLTHQLRRPRQHTKQRHS